MIRNLKIKGNFFNVVKGIYKTTGNIIFNGNMLNNFPLR